MGGGTGGRQKGWDSQAETLRNEMGAEGLIWLLRQLSAGRQDWREAGLHGSKPSGEEGWQQAQVAGPGVSHHGWWWWGGKWGGCLGQKSSVLLPSQPSPLHPSPPCSEGRESPSSSCVPALLTRTRTPLTQTHTPPTEHQQVDPTGIGQ